MEYDTLGDPILLPLYKCGCGLTGGCENCNPTERVNVLDKYIEDISTNVVPIEEIRKITDKLPSLTKILIEGR